MDTAINNGDFLLDSRNLPFTISGVEEILQRALMRLTIKKGSFIYDPNIGSKLYTLKASSGNIQAKALCLVREALSDMTQVIVDNVSVNLTNNGENLDLNVYLSIQDRKREVAITL